LLEDIDTARSVVTDTLEQLSKNDLQKDYPIPVFDEKTNTSYFLLYLLNHLNYHLGQINYHRRIVCAQQA